MALTFSDPALEAAFQRHRQLFLAKQDVHFGGALGLIALLWLARLAALDGDVGSSHLRALLLRGGAIAACCLLPTALAKAWGLRGYARRRHVVALSLRLALQYPVAVGANLVPALSRAADPWHALGRLFLVAHGFTLLAVPLSFSLAPVPSAACQAVAVALAMRRLPAACSSGYLAAPPVRASLTQVCNWLGHCPTLTPISLPVLDLDERLAQGPLPCLLLGFWLQFCFLFVLPSLPTTRADFHARKEFVLLPGRLTAVPGVDRRRLAPDLERWSASSFPPLWLLLGLFMPAFAMAALRLAGAVALSRVEG